MHALRCANCSTVSAPLLAPPRCCPPRLEELEARQLLSASSPVSVVQPDLPASLVAQPNLDAQPLASPAATVYYNPQQISKAYGYSMAVLPNNQPATGAGQTIAVVDAYIDPNIQQDLATFDATFGLPAPPWFGAWPMNGATAVNSSWSMETALDVEWAHAVAPGANILLVEAASNNYSDLLTAVQAAAASREVVAVSMSWGGPEFAGERNLDHVFTTPAGHQGGWYQAGNVSFIASSGDSGAGAQWPASSPNVLAVGGTSLALASNGGYGGESAWSGSGGGISHQEFEPAAQYRVQASGARTVPDVAYDANPSTGVLVYDTVGLPAGYSGWWIVGGTSAGAPQWAGITALVDQARGINHLGSLGNIQQAVYHLSSTDFHDVQTGSNGYSAIPGYDLVTGLGSPRVNRIVSDLATMILLPSSSVASAASTAATGRPSALETSSGINPADGTSSAPGLQAGVATPDAAGPAGTMGRIEIGANSSPGSLLVLLHDPAALTTAVPWQAATASLASLPPSWTSGSLGLAHHDGPAVFDVISAGAAAAPVEEVTTASDGRILPDSSAADDSSLSAQPGAEEMSVEDFELDGE